MLTQQSQEIARSVPDPFPSWRGVGSGHETTGVELGMCQVQFELCLSDKQLVSSCGVKGHQVKIAVILLAICHVAALQACSYSGASLNGPSQKRPTSLERTPTKAQIDFSMHLMQNQPPRSGHFSAPDNGQQPSPHMLAPVLTTPS